MKQDKNRIDTRSHGLCTTLDRANKYTWLLPGSEALFVAQYNYLVIPTDLVPLLSTWTFHLLTSFFLQRNVNKNSLYFINYWIEFVIPFSGNHQETIRPTESKHIPRVSLRLAAHSLTCYWKPLKFQILSFKHGSVCRPSSVWRKLLQLVNQK